MVRKKTETDIEETTKVNAEQPTAEASTDEAAAQLAQEERNDSDSVGTVKYAKHQIMQVAEQKFGLNRTEAITAFFDAPDEMTVEEAEEFVTKFKERTVE
ncbi:hypothetical protein [Brevibacillus fulvus]|uniref:YqzN/YkzM domain-containing protein n=1 Tax=Brevibacillus fulvus TaxID=1125967 RepID=A0A939BSM5_9BACL|nr:hypothetical protein [Brevibacillus fulvus]MBM7590882.1 hypothetical protein [Brevibacillus fulvus]